MFRNSIESIILRQQRTCGGHPSSRCRKTLPLGDTIAILVCCVDGPSPSPLDDRHSSAGFRPFLSAIYDPDVHGFSVSLQSNAATPASQTEIATASPAFSESLRPALQQVGNSVGQIHIDHWKLSQELESPIGK